MVKISLYDLYYNYHEKYVNEYGDPLVVFMQVGGFYEIYAEKDGDCVKKGADLLKIKQVIQLEIGNKDGTPFMGFPIHNISKYINIFLSNKYRIVVVDQIDNDYDKENNNRLKRKVTNIYSPSTAIETIHTARNNNTMLIYIEDVVQLDNTILQNIGLSCIDVTTGECIVHETYPLPGDDKYSLDETSRFITTYDPLEIIFYHKKCKQNINNDDQKIIEYLELDKRKYIYRTEIDKLFFNVDYQNEILQKSYKNTKLLSPILYIGMEMMPQALISLVLLLDFLYKQNGKIIENIYKPDFFNKIRHLVLDTNSIFQLNIFNHKFINDQFSQKNKISCLFDIIDDTSTVIGKRFLKKSIISPLISKKQINKRYDIIEYFLKNENIVSNISKSLKKISDFERHQKKLSLNLIKPKELLSLINNYTHIDDILNILLEINDKKIKYVMINNIAVKNFKNMLKYLNNIFSKEKLAEFNESDPTQTLFNVNVVKDIDEYLKKINVNETIISNFVKEISQDILLRNKNRNYDVVGIKRHQLGIDIFITKNRMKLLVDNWKQLKKTHVNLGDSKININDIEFGKYIGGKIKIKINKLDSISNEIVDIGNSMTTLVKESYNNFIEKFYTKYNKTMRKIVLFIGKLDFLVSNSNVAKKYNYTKPTIAKSDNSFIKTTRIRHPIIERLNTSDEYIPHNINIGIDDDNQCNHHGMLVYGLNSCGKSSMMKSIGLSIVMAQAGMYVPAETFTYSPYKSLLTRITGNDDIVKGMSSFALEMYELKSIIKRSSKNTLVIGDEVCKGTENKSANALVAATLIKLCEKKTSFIFATHLHDIPKLEEIQQLEHLKISHITVKIDQNKLIFDRQLKDGSGQGEYGILFAQHIINDDDFIKLAKNIRNNTKYVSDIVIKKKSKYNSSLFMDRCQLCGKQNSYNKDGIGYFDTHHINHQKNCKNGFVIDKPYLLKNDKSNLIVLCKRCHSDLHSNKFNVTKLTKTSDGIVPEITFVDHNYKRINKIKKYIYRK